MNSKPSLDQYLRRIKFVGNPAADVATLRQLQRRHLAAIPYENLDVQLNVPVGFDFDAIFAKLVQSRRGGWCFEMNGLFAWALEQIGFKVTRMAGAVMREQRGESVIGNHLVLCVHLDQPYLADVGFGDGLIEPVPVMEGPVRQDFLDFRLEQVDDWWRFHNHPAGGASSFDFQLRPALPGVLEAQSCWLQQAPESGFVQTAVCQRYERGELFILRGIVLKVVTEHGTTQRTLARVEEYENVLDRVFGITVGNIDQLWRRINARHIERQQQQVQQ
jgi:N-hydroxyarylamine O-acetyltransferase